MILIFWILVAFFISSIPWPMVLGFLFLNRDIREIGDNNPGGTNAWKMGGWKIGISSIFLDLSKAFVPIYCVINFTGIESWGISAVAVGSLLGNAFTPFLKFRGGKSLAVTGGIWIAISNGWLIIPVMISLATFHSLQRTHVWTIILTMFVILSWVILRDSSTSIIIFWLFNLNLIVLKHRNEIIEGIIPRNWLMNIVRKQK
ncbi:MAG: hypothetical protein CL764_02475 [Chloroflexi bacterium]|nr:hypothetical protein [Chloroflexota bacterium]|tara:strand:- start:3616 stop:4221 length:606 start_codon:yes stop_codon:yes gene_type:complete